MFFSNIRYLLIIIYIFLIFNKLCNAQDVDELYYNIIASFPTPGTSPQGLAWDSTYIWLSDDSTDTIYKISPVDGSVIYSFCTPGPEPRGMTYDGTNLWNLDDSLRKIFKLNQEDGVVIDSIDFPDEVDGLSLADFSFMGLTWDGKHFYTNFEAGWSSQIIKIYINNDSASHFTYTSGYSKGLGFDSEFIWNCSDNGGYNLGLAKGYDTNGLLVKFFYTPGFYPTDITYDGSFFWIADSELDSLYCIQLLPTNIGIIEKGKTPARYILHQNYPNPFNSSTTILYSLPKTMQFSIKIYNLLGQEVKTLYSGQKQAGKYKLIFNANNLAGGIYIYRLQTDKFSTSKKLLLLK